jgi:hypothetical protein
VGVGCPVSSSTCKRPRKPMPLLLPDGIRYSMCSLKFQNFAVVTRLAPPPNPGLRTVRRTCGPPAPASRGVLPLNN